MGMTMKSSNVGKIVKIIWDEETDVVQIVMEITDPVFKDRVLHTKEFQDVISFEGKDVMMVASKSRKHE